MFYNYDYFIYILLIAAKRQGDALSPPPPVHRRLSERRKELDAELRRTTEAAKELNRLHLLAHRRLEAATVAATEAQAAVRAASKDAAAAEENATVAMGKVRQLHLALAAVNIGKLKFITLSNDFRKVKVLIFLL